MTRHHDSEQFLEKINSLETEIKTLKKSLEEYADIFSLSLDMICIADINTTQFLKVNPAFTEILGYGENELLHQSFLDFIHPDDIAPTQAVVEKKLKAGKKVINFINRYRCSDGRFKWLEWVSQPMPERGITFAVAHDITPQKEMETALKINETFIRAVMDNLPIGIAVNSVDPGVTFEYMNANFPKFYRTTKEKLAVPDGFWEAVYEDPEYREKIKHQVLDDCASGNPDQMVWEDVPITRKGRKTRYVTARNTPVPDKGLMISTVWDVTAQKTAEADLTDTKRLLEETQALARMGGWEYDIRTERLLWTKEVFRIHGLKVIENPVPLEKAISFYKPEHQSLIERSFQHAVKKGTPYDLELELVRQDGTETWIRTLGRPVEENGRIVRINGNIQDITERKLAESEREKLQAQLVQSQKMESVGRLAGGVAHDFNNMLSVILGHAEIAQDDIDPTHPVYTALKEIQKAASRSEDLTRQLLAFARKQTVSPRVLNLNNVVEGMLNMLHRLIGENIELVWQPAANLPPVKMDPGQIDQILANLSVNARDAIKDSGKIIIETDRVTIEPEDCIGQAEMIPGSYLLMAVKDNGIGMGKDTLARIFEPFFTTKETGQGTGLGLATVYGIVKQNKGCIKVDSEPGRGTVFQIYLPYYTRATQSDETTLTAKPKQSRLGKETVLVVEDEPAILKMCCTMLKRLGYEVCSAASPGEAVELAESHKGDIHLLLTDVVMPEMNGRELAKTLLPLYPGMKRIFMSGYTADVIAHHGILQEGVNFIQKPFGSKKLSETIRKVLDAS